MKHTLAKVVGLKHVADYTLEIAFDDGTSQRIDFFPFLKGPLFEPLCDKIFFAQVKVDPEAYTLVWPNDADFDSGMLHDWNEMKVEFHAQITGNIPPILSAN